MNTLQGRCCSWLLILLLLPLLPLAWTQAAAQAGRITAVDAVGMTVSDLDRAVTFYSTVLTFEKTNVVEVSGAPYERLQGLTGVRMRTARLRLGEEAITLTAYITPKGYWRHGRGPPPFPRSIRLIGGGQPPGTTTWLPAGHIGTRSGRARDASNRQVIEDSRREENGTWRLHHNRNNNRRLSPLLTL